jgi:hypothetical protein
VILAADVSLGFPQYSVKEGKRCVYCHVDVRGGGPCNARGRYYKENLSFEGYYKGKKSKKRKKSTGAKSNPEPKMFSGPGEG